MKQVAIVKLTNICYAPDFLCLCLNKYSTEYQATLIGPVTTAYTPDWKVSPNESLVDNPYVPIIPVGITDYEALRKMDLSQFDVIHFHNRFIETKIPSLIQYHSPYVPTSVGGYIDENFPGLKTVLAQYQATRPGYKDCKHVRNIVDCYSEEYEPKIIYDKIRIGFSPSSHASGKLTDESKGYDETVDCLNRIKAKYPSVEIDIIEKLTIDECIRRKSLCNILIDECVTTSYHRSGLEALALGKLCICSLGEDVIKVFLNASKADSIPFENIWIDDLEARLRQIIDWGIDYILDVGKRNRMWFEMYWNPKTIVTEFEEIYNSLLKG